MSTNNHIQSLRFRHTFLDQNLLEEEQRPRPNLLVISEIKQKKLFLKDEISRLSRLARGA